MKILCQTSIPILRTIIFVVIQILLAPITIIGIVLTGFGAMESKPKK